MITEKSDDIKLNEMKERKKKKETNGSDTMCEVVPERIQRGDIKKFLLPSLVRHKKNKTFVEVLSKPEDQEIDEDGGKRETWDKKIDFLLSMIGFAVDLSNIWRFPFLCYKNGGGAFLIPYFIMLICGALPLFLMELLLGQLQQRGCIAVWKVVPIFKGIGICQCLITLYVSFYYNVIIAWSFHYLFSSMTSQLPWTSCHNYWNTPNCFIEHSLNNTLINNLNKTLNNTLDNNLNHSHLKNIASNISANLSNISSFRTTPTEEYFERGVLGLQDSRGLQDIGSPRWQLVLCLVLVLTIIYFSLWKGIKGSGKVVWVTATMPYLILTILLIKGLTLPGAFDGIRYFIKPNLSTLHHPTVWLDATVQIFFSVGAGFGVHLAYASHNKKNHNCYRDCLITTAVNTFTSLLSGFVIFSYLGYMAYSQHRDISTVAAEGPGLVFVVYPEAIATLPGSVFWSISFFVMLIMLGIDSALGGFEALMTGVTDEFQATLKGWRFWKETLTFLMLLVCFLVSLPNLTNAGVYLVTLWDSFAAGTAILIGVLAEVVAIGWFYGLDQFCKDIEGSLSFKPNLYWKICWKFLSPLILIVVLLWSFFNSEMTLEYTPHTLPSFVFPPWAFYLGMCISFSSVIFIPLTAIYKIASTPGSFSQRLALNISPVWEHAEIRETGQVKRFKLRHWLW